MPFSWHSSLPQEEHYKLSEKRQNSVNVKPRGQGLRTKSLKVIKFQFSNDVLIISFSLFHTDTHTSTFHGYNIYTLKMAVYDLNKGTGTKCSL